MEVNAKVIAIGIIVALLVGLGGIIAYQLYPGSPEPLKFVVIPSGDPVTTQSSFQPFVEYLSESIGTPVELHLVSDYTAAIEAMKYGHADIARFGPKSYVTAIEEGADVEPFVAGVKANTGAPGYYAYIFARVDSDVAGLEDVNGRSFAYVDPESTSGYAVPHAALEDANIEPSEEFFAGSHPTAILAVKNGTTDAGATASSRWMVALEEGVITEDEMVILWTSPLIPNCPIVMQKSLPSELKGRIVKAFLEAPGELVVAQDVSETHYVPIKDSDYDSIRWLQE